MNKKLNTVAFILAGTVINLIIMAIFIVALVLGSNSLLLALDFSPEEKKAIFQVASMISIFLGMILSFFVYSKIIKVVQKKFDFEKYLEPLFKRKRR